MIFIGMQGDIVDFEEITYFLISTDSIGFVVMIGIGSFDLIGIQ